MLLRKIDRSTDRQIGNLALTLTLTLTMNQTTSTKPPLVTRKMLTRFVVLLFASAAMVVGFQWYRSLGGDLDLPFTVDTAGMIAAVQETDKGSQAVLITPEGKVIASPSYVEGASDRDIAWRPDGSRVYFSSDREERTYNVYRWNPGSEKVERRTFGSRAKSTIEFNSPGVPGANDTALITSGGFVLELNPTDGSTPQLLPPINRERTENSEGGAGSQFDAVYERLGQSFRRAKFAGLGRSWIAAVMRRDLGEVLVLQNLEPDPERGMMPPIPVVAGDRVEFDVNPRTGEVVYCSISFQYPVADQIPPEMIENGRLKKPFEHVIGVIDPTNLEKRMEAIIASGTDDLAFMSPKVSPDGNTLLVLSGKHTGSGQIEVQDLVVMPARSGGGQTASRVFTGRMTEPSWAPDSTRILFVMPDKGKRAIHEVHKDGSGLKNLTNQIGNFSRPLASPQRKG